MAVSSHSTPRTFARFAAAIFLLYGAYPLITKIIEGRLAGDWLHTLFHFVSAGAAAFAGFSVRDERASSLYSAFIAAAYLALGFAGLFIDGLLLGTDFALPLGPADNIFHFLIGAAALLSLILDRRRVRTTS